MNRGQRKVINVVIATSIFWILITRVFYSRSLHDRASISRCVPSVFSSRTDSDISGSSGTLADYRFPEFANDRELHKHAFRKVLDGPGPGTPRIAFLFTVKGPIELEPVWRKFLQGHEELWSLYVHASNPVDYKFPPGSIFEGREIPSKPVARISISLVDAIRRLLAYALADPHYNNAWFVNVCESTVPVRGFPAVYEYLIGSKHSFVEAFLPEEKYQQWDTMPEFPVVQLRKGETWMQMTRKHAIIIVTDTERYAKFAASCSLWCAPDEEYFQTLLHLEDVSGIANRTTMYANWEETRPIPGSPRSYGSSQDLFALFDKIRKMTQETDGLKQESALDKSPSSLRPICKYNGITNATCFLFARKFEAEATSAILHVMSTLPGF